MIDCLALRAGAVRRQTHITAMRTLFTVRAVYSGVNAAFWGKDRRFGQVIAD